MLKHFNWSNRKAPVLVILSWFSTPFEHLTFILRLKKIPIGSYSYIGFFQPRCNSLLYSISTEKDLEIGIFLHPKTTSFLLSGQYECFKPLKAFENNADWHLFPQPEMAIATACVSTRFWLNYTHWFSILEIETNFRFNHELMKNITFNFYFFHSRPISSGITGRKNRLSCFKNIELLNITNANLLSYRKSKRLWRN